MRCRRHKGTSGKKGRMGRKEARWNKREERVEGKRGRDKAVKQLWREEEGGRKGRGHCSDEARNMSDLTWAHLRQHNVSKKSNISGGQQPQKQSL